VTRVVVADDETLVRADVRATLERVGLDVCGEAADGHAAVALARTHRPDLVVIDAGMPVLDGVEASRRILAEADVPIVMLTGYSYGDLISRALEAGVAAYVVKPFSEEALLEAVAAALRGGHTPETLAYLRRRD
jgi:two-component system, response regulator PdtaR